MTSKEIQETRMRNLSRATLTNDLLAEIALQLALLNEHNARMEARYMELTKPGVRSQKSGARRKQPVQHS